MYRRIYGHIVHKLFGVDKAQVLQGLLRDVEIKVII